jgi:hypothetical protein
MGVDSDDEEFVADGSDDEAITGKPTEAVKCKRCEYCAIFQKIA